MPVSDQDRAKQFYAGQLGFTEEIGSSFGDAMRWVMLRPPGSGTAITLVTWFESMGHGSRDLLPDGFGNQSGYPESIPEFIRRLDRLRPVKAGMAQLHRSEIPGFGHPGPPHRGPSAPQALRPAGPPPRRRPLRRKRTPPRRRPPPRRRLRSAGARHAIPLDSRIDNRYLFS